MRRLVLLLPLLVAGCAREPGLFVEANARAHVNMLADTIGSRPVGTPANARARDYLLDQLRQIGFETRVQETDARRHELGLTTRVSNIIAVLPGERREAIGLVSHYDSSPHAPGAADAALGVGAALEAARVFVARGRPRWSLYVLLTDGEETGLMGASALVTDRDVMERLQVYLNLEAIGSAGVPHLFETGPGNAWLVSSWARVAPHPRGGSDTLEIYRRLPNDTDFSILKTRNIPGLNFAAVGDSYAYHTARDTADRIEHRTLRAMGENAGALLVALQEVDITRRTGSSPTFFDVGGTVGVSYGPWVDWSLATLALLLGVGAWLRLVAAEVRVNGLARWLLAFTWAWIGAAAAGGGMVAATWLLRSAREVYHPWYARPGRLFLFMIVFGLLVAWSVARAGRWLPARAHAVRHPALVWSITLPAWIVLAAAAVWLAPAAAYKWSLPLLAAGALLVAVPPHRDILLRLASLGVLAVAGTLWLQNTHELLHFMVSVMARQPIVTPVFVYAAVAFAAAVMLAPPLLGLLAAERTLRRPWLLTSILLLAVTVTGSAAYLAPAYTVEQPQRRVVRVLQDGEGPAIWEIGSLEPGLDVAAGAPVGWAPVSTPVSASVPRPPLREPFVFRVEAPPLGPPPIAIGGLGFDPLPDGIRMRLAVVPREPGLVVTFVLPSGLTPARSSLPGVTREGRWMAGFAAPPLEGIAWEASFRGASVEALRGTQVIVTSFRLPGGAGWQSLPAWLPQDTAVWLSSAAWVVPATSAPAIAPVPPLR